MSDFTVVSHKKKRRSRKNVTLEYDERSSEYFDKLEKKIFLARESLEASGFCMSVKSLIEDSLKLLENPAVFEIVCYGLGSFSESNSALYQYGLLLELKEFLSCRVCLYDPVFKEVEKDILKHANCVLIDQNEKGEREASKTTLFYLPHCPNELINSIIAVNWGLNLSNCIILGNSIHELLSSKTDKELKATLPFILRAFPLVNEVPIPNTFKFVDVFNDLSMHIFPKEKCTALVSHSEDDSLESFVHNLSI